MNWHVLVIMQSFISHRFLFIGNLGKSLKNWPSHLTTTGFSSTWLGVGGKYFHIFMHCWLIWKCWKQGCRRQQGMVTQPHAQWVLLPPSLWDQWEHSHVIRGFEVWSMAEETGIIEAEEGDFCSTECSQIRAGCESLWLTGSSWALLGHWQKESFASFLS